MPIPYRISSFVGRRDSYLTGQHASHESSHKRIEMLERARWDGVRCFLSSFCIISLESSYTTVACVPRAVHLALLGCSFCLFTSLVVLETATLCNWKLQHWALWHILFHRERLISAPAKVYSHKQFDSQVNEKRSYMTTLFISQSLMPYLKTKGIFEGIFEVHTHHSRYSSGVIENGVL